MTFIEAINLRRIIEKASTSLTDDDALEAKELFPTWAVGITYNVGERVHYGEKLYRCEQSHTAQEDWTPDITPALWTDVALPHTIPVWRQPTGAQDAYNAGDRVWYPDEGDVIYESLIDGNVWSPESYPDGWEVIEE